MSRINCKVVIITLVMAVFLGSINVAEAVLSSSEREKILNEAMEDGAKIIEASMRLKSAMFDCTKGSKSEVETFVTATDLFLGAYSLSNRAADRCKVFMNNYPSSETYTRETTRLFKVLRASYWQAESFYCAARMATERYRKRDKELSEGEKEALEELVTVYTRLSDVYSDLLDMWNSM